MASSCISYFVNEWKEKNLKYLDFISQSRAMQRIYCMYIWTTENQKWFCYWFTRTKPILLFKKFFKGFLISHKTKYDNEIPVVHVLYRSKDYTFTLWKLLHSSTDIRLVLISIHVYGWRLLYQWFKPRTVCYEVATVPSCCPAVI